MTVSNPNRNLPFIRFPTSSTTPSNNVSKERNKGGRPKGSTIKSKNEHAKMVEAAKVWATERFIDAKSKTVRLRKNELAAIINDA
jgi:hypothetical protein